MGGGGPKRGGGQNLTGDHGKQLLANLTQCASPPPYNQSDRGQSRNLDLAIRSGKKKQHKHKLFGPDFPRTFRTLTPGRPGVKKFLPTTGLREKDFVVRTSTIFGADVHDPKGFLKILYKKVCVDFLAPSYFSGSGLQEI